MIFNNFLKRNKFNKAQILVEFAIIAPILIIFLLIIIEFGYAITVRNAVSEATKDALMQVNSKFNNITGTTAVKKAALENSIQESISDYLISHSIPNASEVEVFIYTDGNGVSTVRATYQYKLMIAAILPMLLSGNVSPTIPLQSSQIINTAMVQANNFNSGLTTQQLSGFFPTASSALTAGGMINASNSTVSGYDMKEQSAILVSWYDDYDVTNLVQTPYARLYGWYGYDLLPANLRVNLRTATLEVRSPYYNSGNWFNTQIPYVWVVSALGYTQVFYTKFNSTVDFNGTQGWTFNECTTSGHHWGPDSCPLEWGGNTYQYLYRVEPKNYDPTDHDQFMKSLGYRWCGGTAAGIPACNSTQVGFHTVQELALKGIIREGVYCISCGLNHNYSETGNYDYINNTGATNINSLQHYTARTPDYNTPFTGAGDYLVNIYQPVISNYYTASNPVDATKMQLNDTNTTDANGNSTPLFTVFKWSFNINASGVYDASGAANTDIVDVYIDTDMDGIPDAWDNHPTYLDANGNGVSDGFDNSVTFNASADILYDTMGADYIYPIPGLNFVSGLNTYSYLTSFPFMYNGALLDSKKTNPLLKYYVPQYYHYNLRLFGGKLYFLCDPDLDASPLADDVCRQIPTWTPAIELTQKSRFIRGSICGGNICLDKSDDLTYLDANNFSAVNRVSRTPVGW